MTRTRPAVWAPIPERVELVAGATEVTQPVLDQAGSLTGQAVGLVRAGESPNRLVQVGAEDERDAPLVDALLRLRPGVTDGLVRVHLDRLHAGAHACRPSLMRSSSHG